MLAGPRTSSVPKFTEKASCVLQAAPKPELALPSCAVEFSGASAPLPHQQSWYSPPAAVWGVPVEGNHRHYSVKVGNSAC
eukprot:2375920-Alexandrium_andersonii.AAC.1